MLNDRQHHHAKDNHDKQHTASPDTLTAEVYQISMRQGQLRAELQSKCVEMSIHVTTGLAAAIAAAWIAVLVRSSVPPAYFDFTKIRLPIVLASGFYGFIQSLILTNYIYQTFHLLCVNWTFEHVKVSHLAAPVLGTIIVSDMALMQSKETTHLGNWRRRFLSKLLTWFQPLVLYLSVAIAWLVASCGLLLSPYTIFTLCWTIVIVAVLWCSFLFLLCLHIKADGLAKDSMRDFLKNLRQTTI